MAIIENAQGGNIESRKDFDKDPKGQFEYYAEELKASMSMLDKWHKTADKINNKYTGKATSEQGKAGTAGFKLNLFHSNITTLESMLYGNLPTIDVARRHADPSDDIARVAGATLERLLNLDVQDNGAEVDSVFRATLQDRLLAGLGCARVRYDADIQNDELIDESAPVEYYHWGDVLWSWARSWSEVRWVAFRSYLTKDEIAERFGTLPAEKIPLKQQKMTTSDDAKSDAETDGAWKKGEIWEIWDKIEKKVVWVAFGYEKTLEEQADPLRLSGFFPTPPFLLANPTTQLYIPTPDYKLAEDLYNEIDKLQERISIITEAMKVVGVYDASNAEIQTMLNHGMDNKLIPVSNWALFGEKQGLKGQIDWMPIGDIVAALDKLRELRSEAISLLQQVTGMSDVMRGGLDSPYEANGQSQLKAKFGSVRIQALQDQFARFATDLFQLKAEIIAKHFSPETIARKSNMAYSQDRELLPQAIQLIKNPQESQLRVQIRPESVAMVDYAQLKQERTEYINALSTFMQSAAPLMDKDPNAKPFLLELLQWGLAGFKGASEIEGTIDRAIEASQQEAKQGGGKPDPAQIAAQMAMQQEQLKQQGESAKIQAKAQADMKLREQDHVMDLQLAQQSHQMKLEQINADMQRSITEMRIKLQADLLVEQAQTQSNIASTQATMEGEMQKDAFEAEISMATESEKTFNKIAEIQASAEAKIRESRVAVKEQAAKTDGDDDDS